MNLGGYELGPEIGSGAMGSVHLAHERQSGTAFALKRIHPKYADQKQTLRRFAIEVQTAARLRHPNIVSVVASGTESRGTPYCVMDWVSGEPLSEWTDGSLSWSRIAWIVKDLLDALAYAHARGVVHRDLKPANLLVESPYTEEARVRLVDFGIARLLEAEGDDPEATRLTMDDRVLGTPAYLSPEQAQGLHHLIGPHTDLYAVGVILYELIAGQLPFGEMPVVSLLLAHAAKTPPPLDLTDRPDVPLSAAKVVQQLLKKAPEDRPESAKAVKEALGLSDEITRRSLPKRREKPIDLDDEATQPTLLDGGVENESRATLQLAMDVRVKPESLELLGRDEEMVFLTELARRTRVERRSRAVFVHGEAGIGKSRLVQEARYRIEESGQYLGARMVGRGGVSEDEAVRRLLARLMLAERLSGDALERRVTAAAKHCNLDALDTRALTAWFEGDPAIRREPAEMVEVAARAIRAIAVRRPLALIVEGIDSESASFTVEVLTRLFVRGDRARWDRSLIFLMAPTRLAPMVLPEPAGPFYKTLHGFDRADVLKVPPLTDDVMLELVRDLAPDEAERIASRARGNPLFALELARYKVSTPLVATPEIAATLPGSIGDVWQRRIAESVQVAPEPNVARCVLTAAAILGPSVPRESLVSTVSEALVKPRDVVESALDLWVRVEFLIDDGAREPTISFVHTLGYEHVIDHIAADDVHTVALLHYVADGVIATRSGMDPDLLVRLADLLDGQEDRTRAAAIRILAGEIRVGHLEYPRAEQIFRELAKSARDDGQRALATRAASELANVQILQGDVQGAERSLAEFGPVLTLAGGDDESISDLAVLIGLIRAQANLAIATGKPRSAVDLLHQAVELAKESADLLSLAAVRTQLSHALERGGKMADAERQCRLAISSLKETQAPDRLLSRAYISLASLCRRQGRIDEADEAANSARSLAEAIGDQQQLDQALKVLLFLASDRGDTDRAIGLAEQVVERQRTFGNHIGIARAANMLGVLERHRGELSKADALHREALEQLEHVPDRELYATNIVNLGIVCRRQKHLDKALEHFERAGEVFAEISDAHNQSRLAVEVALVLRERGQIDDAESLCRDSLRQKLELFDFAGAALAQLVLGTLAADRNNWSVARELFSESRSAFADMGIYRDTIAAETWLALAGFELGQRQQAEMAARRIEERLRDRPVFKRLLSRGLRRLAERIAAGDQEISWRLEDRARQIDDRLERIPIE